MLSYSEAKAQIVDNEDGIVIDHDIEAGKPPDTLMLASAIERIKQRIGQAPRAATADRDYAMRPGADDGGQDRRSQR